MDDNRFDAHRVLTGDHPERPERLVAARAGLHSAIGDGPRLLVPARAASLAELTRVHAPTYVEQLEAQLARGSGTLDADTYYCPGTREAAWLAAGGAIDLAESLIAGTSRRGLALLRPPGHHAVPRSSMGFCLLNNVAIAATAALAAGLQRVAIVDWDVHHGNGTQEMFYDDPRVLFISLHQYPFYPGTGAAKEIGRGAGQGFTANLALPAESGDEVYGAAFRDVVLPLLRTYAPELVLVSAGFDAHARDPLANMNLSSDTYGAMASALIDLVDGPGPAEGRIGFLLEGGYDLHALNDSVQHVAQAMLGKKTELARGKLSAAELAAVEATRKQLAPFWHFVPS
ncbi:MAG TPA: histone deacetylase [Polyangiales bacterium]|nr:histone deacetylase [Polyangiales bacterium]